jgi:hypothetical protein
MKLEDKQRLKRFWQAKVLLLTSAIGGMTFVIITRVPVILNLHDSISQKPDISHCSQITPAFMRGPCEDATLTIEAAKKEEVYQRLLLENLLLIGMSFGPISALHFSLRHRNPYPLSWSG